MSSAALFNRLLDTVLRRRRSSSPQSPAGPRPERIESNHVVADVLSWYPRTMEVFERFGFTLLRNPIARRTLARTVTVAQAARMGGISLDALLHALNEPSPGSPESLGSTENAASPDSVESPDGSQLLRYDTSVNELIAQLPGAEKVLAQAGLNLDDSLRLPLGEAADRVGVPRETVLTMLAPLAVGPDSHCRGDCSNCEGHIEDGNRSCDHAKQAQGPASPSAPLEVSR